MIQVYPDEGLNNITGLLVNLSVDYHLYTNNYTPVRGSVYADLTEAAWTGYAVVTRTNSDWPTYATVGHVGTRLGPPMAFLNSSGGDVSPYGYFVTLTGQTIILWAGRFDSAPNVVPDGESLTLFPFVAARNPPP